MVSGDRESVATRIGRALGVDRVYADRVDRVADACTPAAARCSSHARASSPAWASASQRWPSPRPATSRPWPALFQEVIDLAFILNALRALHG